MCRHVTAGLAKGIRQSAEKFLLVYGRDFNFEHKLERASARLADALGSALGFKNKNYLFPSVASSMNCPRPVRFLVLL